MVIAAGLDGTARAEALAICRRHGMRMVGPASFGVANPSICLDATFAGRHPTAGSAGLAFQSAGGTGFVLVEHLSRLGVGISSFVSLGDTDDVSGEDMLLWWESDPATKLALLYLESIREPAQVRPHRPPRRPHHAGPDRDRGPVRGGRAWPGRAPPRLPRCSPGRPCSSRPG